MDRLLGQHMSSQTDANAFVARHQKIHLDDDKKGAAAAPLFAITTARPGHLKASFSA